MVPVGRDVKLAIPIDHGGPNVLEFEVEPGPHELTLVNNRAVVVVNGVRDRLRVLLVSGEPHAGERVWRNILKSDPVGRPRAFHDPASAGEAGRHADPRIVADRLSDPRAVRRQARRFRPDHLRPLQRSAASLPQAYLENIVALRAERRRAFSKRPGPASARPMSLYRTPFGEMLPAEPTGNVDGGRLQAAGDRGRPAPPGDRGPARRAGQAGRSAAAGAAGSVRSRRSVNRGTTVMNGRSTASRSWCSTGSARAGWRSCCRTRCGCGRAASKAAGRRPSCCAALAYWLMKEPDLEENDLRAAVEGNRLVVTRQSLEPDDQPGAR